jgi:hypothetical protein
MIPIDPFSEQGITVYLGGGDSTVEGTGAKAGRTVERVRLVSTRSSEIDKSESLQPAPFWASLRLAVSFIGKPQRGDNGCYKST